MLASAFFLVLDYGANAPQPMARRATGCCTADSWATFHPSQNQKRRRKLACKRLLSGSGLWGERPSTDGSQSHRVLHGGSTGYITILMQTEHPAFHLPRKPSPSLYRLPFIHGDAGNTAWKATVKHAKQHDACHHTGNTPSQRLAPPKPGIINYRQAA